MSCNSKYDEEYQKLIKAEKYGEYQRLLLSEALDDLYRNIDDDDGVWNDEPDDYADYADGLIGDLLSRDE